MDKLVQPPKGTRDFLPEEMMLRRRVMETIRECFALYGFVEIDSPVFEYLGLLSRKCGEEIEKEIYTFEDKAKRKLGLRFEFTSPLGRYYASNAEKLHKPFKRYIIGKVYRYENTQLGRYREFYQADADIIGSYSMNVELELLDMAVFTLSKLSMGSYEILINSRKILDGIINACGISDEKKDAALRALDKMSKIGEDGVIGEFGSNDIDKEKYDAFMGFIKSDKEINDTEKLLILKERLSKSIEDESIRNTAVNGVDELLSVFENAKSVGLRFIKYEPLLVRGLGYYTGPIFEIKSKDVGIGSFAAGGRYDNLVELYGARPEGACGISFGVERIIDIIKQRDTDALKIPVSFVKLYVFYLSNNERTYAYQVTKMLRLKGISVELSVSASFGISKEIKYASRKMIDYVAIIGENEVSEKKLTIKNIKTREEKLITLEETISLLQDAPLH